MIPKELPFFKFFHNDWMGGLISRQPRDLQGFFIDLCSTYWKQQCKGSIKKIKAYMPDYDQYIERCLDLEIVDIKNEKLTIKFLDRQREEFLKKSKRNSKNGSKGGRSKSLEESEYKANQNPKTQSRQAFSELDSELDSYTDSELELDRSDLSKNDPKELHPIAAKVSKIETLCVVNATNRKEVTDLIRQVPDKVFDQFIEKCRELQDGLVADGMHKYKAINLIPTAMQILQSGVTDKPHKNQDGSFRSYKDFL